MLGGFLGIKDSKIGSAVQVQDSFSRVVTCIPPFTGPTTKATGKEGPAT